MDWQLVLNIVLLIVGMALLVKGADFFVDGASSIAKALKIPSLIIGLTLVSMGTSAPEAAVSITSAIGGNVEMSVGNIVGSDIFNTLFILGISALIVPLVINPDMKRFDIPIMLGLYTVMLLLSFVISPKVITRLEGIVLLVLFVAYMVFLFLRAKHTSEEESALLKEEAEQEKASIWKAILWTAAGLAAIIIGGKFSVDCAEALALEWGMSESLVGLTILAIGTSLPELVTTITAIVKKESALSAGNIIGANVLDLTLIMPLCAVVSGMSLPIASTMVVDLVACLVVGTVALVPALAMKKFAKWQGFVLLGLYAVYLVITCGLI